MKKIGIIGAGNIGKIIYKYLKDKFNVEMADIEGNNVYILDVYDKKELDIFVSKKDVIIAATPFYMNKYIIDSAILNKVAYFDLTEDTTITDYCQLNANNSIVMPQCGLAPGLINILGNSLAQQFDTVSDINLRVGALPLNPNNNMKYYTSWSIPGIVNEYCNVCNIRHNGQMLKIPALTGLEELVIDGIVYEAFNTSGGIGTLCDTYSKSSNIDYKSIRYKGHYNYMKFLKDDLDLKNDRQLFVKLMERVPKTTEDVVIIYINIIGTINSQLIQKTTIKKIYSHNGETAIQRATASGVCSIVDLYCNGYIKQTGFIRQEEIEYISLIAKTKFIRDLFKKVDY